MFNHKRIARLSVDKKRGFSILRDSHQGAERRKVFTMSSRHILFYVFEVERHEGINPVVRLDTAVFRKPRPPRRGRQNVINRFGDAATRQCEDESDGREEGSQHVSWS